MADSNFRSFTARLSALPDLLAFLRGACEHAGIGPAATLRVELVLEELFTNTVRHGYRGDSDASVWLSVTSVPGSLIVTYQDAAPPHDPLSHTAPLPDALEERTVGGLGIRLARELTRSIAYCREGDRNVLRLTFQHASHS